ncbi:hypothetical protein HanRHA438_Chr13g0611491 [Helianthus annuus]|nr:hypothetical protein HanIR_Chr13g0653661 [Helianthus annuus]KAJ0859358.1 hypothetical protein HanRHA438_Chr13g0611491 [Helianthus annuus]
MEMPNVFHSYLRFKKMRANLHPTALEHPGSRSIGISDRRTNNRISIVAHLHHRQIHVQIESNFQSIRVPHPFLLKFNSLTMKVAF